MTHASRKASSQKAARPQPYNRERPGRFRQPPHDDQPPRQQQSTSSSASMRPFELALPSPSSSRGPRLSSPSSSDPGPDPDVQNTRRAHLLERIRERYPDYRPLNDFEIFVLGISNDVVPKGDLRTWLDGKFAQQLEWKGDAEGVFEDARIFLDLSGGISGVKPRPGTRNVYVRPIPDSEYSLRLFPGNKALQEYCADFVRTGTGQAVDCPPGFELWGSPTGPAAFLGSRRLRSLERTFSCFARRAPGTATEAETFVLKDGQDYVLKRPGHPNVRFTVPTRAINSQDSPGDDHVLTFPTYAL